MVQHSDTATHIKWKIFDLVSTFFVTFKIMMKCDIRLTILLFLFQISTFLPQESP